MHQMSFGCYSKGHNSRKGDNLDKKKNVCQIFFHEESIHEISKPQHARFLNGQMLAKTDAWTHNLKPICPINFFEAGDIVMLYSTWCIKTKFNVAMKNVFKGGQKLSLNIAESEHSSHTPGHSGQRYAETILWIYASFLSLLAACIWCMKQINPSPICVSSFNFVGLTEKCDKINVLEFERKRTEEIKE